MSDANPPQNPVEAQAEATDAAAEAARRRQLRAAAAIEAGYIRGLRAA